MAEAEQKPKRKKATKAEKKQRIEIVYKMLLAGSSRSKILQYTAEKFQLSERQTDDYIRQATEAIKGTEYDRAYEKNRTWKLMDEVTNRALNISDFRSVFAARDMVHKLQGDYPPKQYEILHKYGVDEKLLIAVFTGLQEIGRNPSDHFEALLQVIAEEKARAE